MIIDGLSIPRYDDEPLIGDHLPFKHQIIARDTIRNSDDFFLVFKCFGYAVSIKSLFIHLFCAVYVPTPTIGYCVLGFYCDRLFEVVDRSIIFGFFVISMSTIEVGRSEAGVYRDGCGAIFDCFVILALLEQHSCQPDIRFC